MIAGGEILPAGPSRAQKWHAEEAFRRKAVWAHDFRPALEQMSTEDQARGRVPEKQTRKAQVAATIDRGSPGTGDLDDSRIPLRTSVLEIRERLSCSPDTLGCRHDEVSTFEKYAT